MYKILLAVDGSDPSVRATRALIESLREHDAQAQIDVVTVHRPLPNVGTAGLVLTKEMTENYYRQEFEQALGPCTRLLDEAKLPYNVHRVIGPIAESIVEKAEELGSDLIYMGTHGRGGATRLVLGSVANKVLQLTRVPVQLVK
ncbi:MAG: universal stress protein [Burkholderiales bacterium]|nr:universal stress protein [Burkholderiales bacterium]PZN01466.1 MAG: universal stress protein [Pseudomonadota bacterium]